VLFPASADVSRHNLVKEGLAFRVRISFERCFEADILCAVWAWSSFGGIGSRTRRGCGALFCEELSPEEAAPDSIARWWKRGIDDYGLRLGAERDWPTLSRIFTGSVQVDSLSAWQESVRPMQSFRQKAETGRNAGREANRPGRSRWPEPDTLRRAFGTHAPDHKPDSDMPDGFPRAALGLPIIFHFAGGRGDPDSEVRPRGSTRMASPLILRPLKTRRDGQKAVPLVVQLRGTTLKGKELEVKGSGKQFGAKYIVNADFANYRNSPMRDRSADGSAVEAFLRYAGELGFHGVQA
jgi:CRISPR-associated protein Cmr1